MSFNPLWSLIYTGEQQQQTGESGAEQGGVDDDLGAAMWEQNQQTAPSGLGNLTQSFIGNK